MSDRSNITWTPPKLDELKKVYNAARQLGLGDDHTILFEGHTLLLGYTKHLIEYLEYRFSVLQD